jgi:eukaryotic-like serine/threonine-protein kinase
MIFQRLRVFVSSKMQELAPERQALKAALDALKVDAWVFEQDAGARPVSIEKAFLEEVEAADLYIGLFWKGYGDYTIEEYEHARRLGKDCLIYEKRAALNGQRDPRLQEFLDRLGNVEKGLTIKWFDDSLQLSEAIKDDVQRLQAKIYRERSKPRININLSLAEKKERDELLILLRKVKEFWVEGVLENSLHGQALIDLGKEAWAEETEHPWEQILELPDQTNRTLRPGEPIGEVFDDVKRSLLILGAPGCGKTITLLDLSRDLISRAESDPSQAIPVVFNLSSWNDPKKTLFHWLIDELQVKYQVPKKIGARWLEENWIVPLLDGLDEVMTANRSACVEAINAYVQAHGTPGLSVCSRLKEYTDLPVRLHVTGAICLQPLTPEQVKDYVAHYGNTLAGLRTALDKDPVLQTLAETPLMLDVMSLAYRDSSSEELTSKALNSEKERRSHLFNTYIDRMFVRKGRRTQRYARERTIGWLIWLARSMQQHGQTVFLIEQLQPSWLITRGQRVAYILGSRMVFGLSLGLSVGLTFRLIFGLNFVVVFGLIFGLLLGLIDELRFSHSPLFWPTVIFVSFCGLITAQLAESHVESPYFLSFILSVAPMAIFWISRMKDRVLTSDIQSVESVRWSRVHARKGFATGIIPWGLGGGVGVMTGLGLSWGTLTVGVTTVLISGMIGGLFGGLRGSVLDLKGIPNLGIKLSFRNAVLWGALGLLAFGLIFGLIFVVIFGLRIGLIFGLRIGLIFGLIFGLVSGVIAILWYGGQDVIQHYVLRFILYWRGYTPLHYANFLDYAARLVLLQKVGSGYIFIHRLLLEHFAAMRKDEKKPLLTS